MTVPVTLSKAAAPLGAALLPPNMFVTLAALACLISSALLVSASRVSEPDSSSP